jgi:hypothetical protein
VAEALQELAAAYQRIPRTDMELLRGALDDIDATLSAGAKNGDVLATLYVAGITPSAPAFECLLAWSGEDPEAMASLGRLSLAREAPARPAELPARLR